MSKNIIEKISQKFKGGVLKYSLDQANTNEIVGWVFDPKSTSDHLVVQLREGDKVVDTIKADELRKDVRDAGFGNGYCGFRFNTQTLFAEQAEARIDLFANGKKLNQEPIVIKFEVQKPLQQTGVLENYRVHIDNNIPGKLFGWAIDDSRQAHKPHIECKLGDFTLGACVADTFRDDLAKAGIGDGKFAFKIDYDVAFLPDDGAGLKVIVDGIVLVNSEKSFILSATDVQKAKDNKQQALFVEGVKQEISEITQQISQHNMNEGLPADSVAGVCSVFVERMAEMSFRLSVIEKALVAKSSGN
ncbi:hypothetical protein [Paraglaciecola sp. MB-3u-78]|uniref:hypothetical protein n=1 Tax=Paraglaciecola sp. MB-3u-78 TaxID=2058332 RepID=UPI000C31D739|nr:hypothetical protein [Paraglaciecola sp. MB-3u-78]PKG95628.1 hypothetical protein CXF95_25835 [Paraglaciecola sp. MB-3u-78]